MPGNKTSFQLKDLVKLGKEEPVAGHCLRQGLLLAYGSTCLMPYGSRTQQPPGWPLTGDVASAQPLGFPWVVMALPPKLLSDFILPNQLVGQGLCYSQLIVSFASSTVMITV